MISARSVCLGLGALLLVPSAAQAKPSPLAIRAVQAPTHATPAAALPIELQLAEGRRAPAAKVVFFLSADAARDKTDAQLPGTVVVRGGQRRIDAQTHVPGAQALGIYHVIACAGKRCVTSRRTLEITGTPVGAAQLVADAVAAKKLTPQQGLVYRALAALGDPRLPAQYAGDQSEPEHTVMRDVAEQWSTLTPAQRAELNPYFSPPPARGAVAARASAASGSAPTCDTEQVKTKNWRTLAMPHGHVRVWWLASMDDRVGPRARSFVTEIENHMWPRLVALLGREPLSDGGERCYHGLDGKLDIYLWGVERGTAITFPYPPRCKAAPAYIVFEARNHLPDRWEVAHELFHAFQYSYNYAGPCSAYNAWDEAAATWAADYLYPKDDAEHFFPWLMEQPDMSFTHSSYEGWVFPYAMQQLHGVATVKAIYDQTEHQPGPLQAIDAAVPGGFKQAWPEFARTAWNADPLTPSFAEWDRFTARPSTGSGASEKPIDTEQIDIGPTGQTEVDMDVPKEPLSRGYRHLKLGPGVTAMTAVTPYNTDLHLDAISQLRDGTSNTEDLQKRRLAVFCPDVASQRLDDLLLIASNTSMTSQLPGDQPIKVVATNIGCHRYTGTVSGSEHVHATNVDTIEKWTADNLVFEREPSGPDNPGIFFKLVAGTVRWSISGSQQGCQISAGPIDIPIKPDGSNGELGVSFWLYDHPIRTYSGVGYNLPQVTGTAKCSTGTYTRAFGPHTFFNTRSYDDPTDDVIPANGILDGGFSEDEHAGGSRDATYNWHLVPQD